MAQANSNTLTPEEQTKIVSRLLSTTGQLRQAKNKNRLNEQEVLKKTAVATAKIVIKHSTKETIRQSIAIGLMLRKEISEGRFSGGTFIVAISLSLFKDLVDFTTMGLIGWFINIAIVLILFIALFGNGAIFKKFFIRIIITIIAESIPLLSILPIYTITTIWIKLSADKKVRELETQAEEVERENEKLKRQL